MDRKQLGRLGIGYAIAYYTKEGYTLSLPLNDTQWYDLIIEKDGKIETVQCKATATSSNTIDFRSTGGTNGGVYDLLTNHPLNRLFCVSAEGNCYDIPLKDLIDFNSNIKTITLRTEPTSNHQGFQTHKYIVKVVE